MKSRLWQFLKENHFCFNPIVSSSTSHFSPLRALSCLAFGCFFWGEHLGRNASAFAHDIGLAKSDVFRHLELGLKPAGGKAKEKGEPEKQVKGRENEKYGFFHGSPFSTKIRRMTRRVPRAKKINFTSRQGPPANPSKLVEKHPTALAILRLLPLAAEIVREEDQFLPDEYDRSLFEGR